MGRRVDRFDDPAAVGPLVHESPIALVVTGAPLAARATEFAQALTDHGHPTVICPSTSASAWIPAISKAHEGSTQRLNRGR